jgi:tRNA-specific 2-thiouridylase
MTRDHLFLLALGRHFRLPTGTKVVVSRNAGESAALEAVKRRYWFFDTVGQGPVAAARPVNRETLDEDEIQMIADLLAHYSKSEDGTMPVVFFAPEGVDTPIAAGEVVGKSMDRARLEEMLVR